MSLCKERQPAIKNVVSSPGKWNPEGMTPTAQVVANFLVFRFKERVSLLHDEVDIVSTTSFDVAS
jgi:hypothetical protein